VRKIEEKSMMVYKYILFDMDGTIANSLELEILTLKKILKNYLNKDYSREELKGTMGIPTYKTIKMFTNNNIEELAEKWMKEFERNLKFVQPFPQARETIKNLYRWGYILGIVSSRNRVELNQMVEHLRIKGFFSALISADDTEQKKPHPEPILKALSVLNAPRERVCYIGDSVFDMESGKRAGVMTFGVTWGASTKEDLEKWKPIKVFNNYSEIQEFFGKEL